MNNPTPYKLLQYFVIDGVKLDYFAIVRKINLLPNVGDNNKWIKAVAAQLESLLQCAVSDACSQHRQQKLCYRWMEYVKLVKEERSSAKR